ncbi:ABC transporter permease [Falsarthrobacter nasiphocae]|uniref:Simple sugar transport system permease protein n=1 Tax=Falsarthrobacter nasiphocae TaxID=189863 RepID=A0AAE3YFC1_9MICC|nr:ABC transporter permease [Falsarthrobacter nasiphocae]MDR6891662.1 simple sugar transport system permease protein [Falsarthrobacter nasiphocae]
MSSAVTNPKDPRPSAAGAKTPKPVAAGAAAGSTGPGAPQAGRGLGAKIFSGSALVSVLSVLVALIVGALLIVVTDKRVIEASSYFFGRPGDTLSAAWDAVSTAYGALIKGATFDPSVSDLAGRFGIFETLTQATPLILTGLAVTVAFRAGLFNIGGMGQLIAGATAAAWVGFTFHLPAVIHLPLVILAGFLGGAVWGGFVGWLKARTGAHEVIVTIMLNNIALFFLLFLLRGAFKAPGGNQPVSAPVADTAMFPHLLGSEFRLNWAFVMAILAVVFVWWFIERSTFGLKIRAIGANPAAARTAGMVVSRGYILAMVIAGGMAGLAGAGQISGTERTLDDNIAGQLGFDAITVALLGRSTPWGTFWAAILFGAFRAGGQAMSVQADVSIDIVLVVQSLIVLFIAAPPLIKAMFGLERSARAEKKSSRKAAKAA